jgi:hypothetical protein
VDESEFASIDENWRQMDRVEIEARTIRLPIDQARSLATAKNELLRRDRKYAERQEKDRRDFEIKMFDDAGMREAARQAFEEKLAQRQMDHASALAREQLDIAQAAARAAKNGGVGSRCGRSRGDRPNHRRGVQIRKSARIAGPRAFSSTEAEGDCRKKGDNGGAYRVEAADPQSID